jgi:hypothetical protein
MKYGVNIMLFVFIIKLIIILYKNLLKTGLISHAWLVMQISREPKALRK